MTLYSLALVLHIASGVVALLTFWTAALLRKGSPRHRRVGQIYLLAMLGVIISGVPLVFGALGNGRPITALFLTYLLLLVSSTCWNAWRAIRDRGNRHAYFGPVYWTLSALVAASGLGIIVLGQQTDALLLTAFGGVGVLAGAGTWRAWKRSASDPKWWLKEHYGAMLGNGVATHIAFIGIGLRGMLPGVDPQLLQSVAWFGPLIVATLAGGWLHYRYGRAPDVRRAARPPALRDAADSA